MRVPTNNLASKLPFPKAKALATEERYLDVRLVWWMQHNIIFLLASKLIPERRLV
jgi:hypothetical protein